VKHDVIISAIPATTRGQFGIVTSAGRIVRLNAIDLPSLPAVTGIPALSAGAPLGAFVDLPIDETPLCLTSIDEAGGVVLATARGVVKRVVADALSNRDSWEIIRLDDGDRVVGARRLAEAEAEDFELVFITSDAQLLRIPASAVRPQGRAAAGMAGIKVAAGAEVISFHAVVPDSAAVVVTIAGSGAALPGTEPGTIKVTPLLEYPAKGRATGGVRCHKLRSGEDRLILSWTGTGPARASTASGTPVGLPAIDARRDATGTAGTAPIAAVAGAL
jgi:DNA gyrase subunit A